MLSMFVTSLIVNLIFILFFKKIVNIYNIYDFPNVKKIHKKKISLVGGFFILINFLIILLFYILFFNNEFFDPLFFGELSDIKDTRSLKVFFVFFIIPIIFFFIGYLDDKFNINYNKKFIIFIFIILSALFIDDSIVIREIKFSFISKNIILGNFSYLFTTFCILVLLNALNMFDGIDLQYGLFYIFLLTILFILGSFSNICLFLILNLCIFLVYNFKKKTFLGNSGNLFLSFFISILIIKTYNFNKFPNAEFVILLLAIPGFDLIRLFFQRLIFNKSPFTRDLDHIHHYLIKNYNILLTNIILVLIIIFPLILYLLLTNFILSFVISLSLYSIIIFKYKYAS